MSAFGQVETPVEETPGPGGGFGDVPEETPATTTKGTK